MIEEFFPFFIIIFTGVFFSMVFYRMHFPWVIGLMLGGIVIGPSALDVITITPTIQFISEIGLMFLMFMAGLETRLSNFKKFKGKLFWLSFVNGFIPFLVGICIAFLFGYGWTAALLVGIIFISSSIAVVIPSLERYALIHTKLGQSVVMTSVIQDVASLILLSIFLQNLDPVTKIPLHFFYPLTIVVLIIFRLIIPKIRKFFTRSVVGREDLFQQEFRVIFVMLLGTVLTFELLGLHPIIAGFFAGFVLSDSIESSILKEKIQTISYGIFIPTFFILIGTQADFSVFIGAKEVLWMVVVIVLGSILSKFFSGWMGGRSVGFSKDQSLLFGVSSVPQLSTTLAVAFTSLSLGIIDQKLITAMVILSVFTIMASPMLMDVFGKRILNSVKKEMT